MQTPTQLARNAALLSMLLAVAGTAGSLALSLGLGLKACPLCFYQRSFIMGAAGVLAISLWMDRQRPGVACLLALPLVFAGMGVAAFHEYLVVQGALECPSGLFGLGTSPAQSLAVFLLLGLASAAGAWTAPVLRAAAPAALLLGLAMAWACVASAPPLPPAPKEPYDPVKQPLDVCRPPYRASAP